MIKLKEFKEDGFTISYEGAESGDKIEWYQIPNIEHCPDCECYDCNDENLSEDGEGFKPKAWITWTLDESDKQNKK